MDELSKAISEFEAQLVKDINACNLHPAIVELVLNGLLGQVKALKNDGGIQNGSNPTESNSSEGDN